MAAVLKSREFWTPQRRLMAGQAQGRRSGRLAGGHILDKADLRKAIVLCGECLGKFDSARAGYVSKSNVPFVRGRCDGCEGYAGRAHLLVHHTLANLA